MLPRDDGHGGRAPGAVAGDRHARPEWAGGRAAYLHWIAALRSDAGDAEKDLHLVLTQVPDGVISDESCLPHTMRELSVDGALINRHVGFPLPFLEQVHRLRIPAVSLNV